MLDSRRTPTLTLLALGVWLVAAIAVGASAGTVDALGDPPIRLAAFVLLPIGVALGAYAVSASFRAFTARLDLAWIVGAHAWRLVGLGFVTAWLFGAMPAGFALPAGLGDAAVAVGALALVPRLRRGEVPRRMLLPWNLFGFVDLVAAIVLGVLYSDGPFGVLATETATTAPMVTFPVSLIPTFLVPLFLLLHGLVFVRLARLDSPSRRSSTSPASPPKSSARAASR